MVNISENLSPVERTLDKKKEALSSPAFELEPDILSVEIAGKIVRLPKYMFITGYPKYKDDSRVTSYNLQDINDYVETLNRILLESKNIKDFDLEYLNSIKEKLAEGLDLKKQLLQRHDKNTSYYRVDLNKIRIGLQYKKDELANLENQIDILEVNDLKSKEDHRKLFELKQLGEKINLFILRLQAEYPLIKDLSKKTVDVKTLGVLKGFNQFYNKKSIEITKDTVVELQNDILEQTMNIVDMEKYWQENKELLEKNFEKYGFGEIEEGLVKINVNGEDSVFDMDYYVRKEQQGMNKIMAAIRNIPLNQNFREVVNHRKGEEIRVKIYKDVEKAYKIFQANYNNAKKNLAFRYLHIFKLAVEQQKDLDMLKEISKSKIRK